MKDLATSEILRVLTASSDAIIATDAAGGIMSWNQGAEYLFGFSESEVCGKSIAKLAPDDYPVEFDSILARLISGETVRRETMCRTKDGRILTVDLTAIPVGHEPGQIARAFVARNVTELRSALQQIAELEAIEAERSLILETASRVALDILTSRTGIEALRHIAEAAREIAHAQYAALGVAHPDGHSLQEFITAGLSPEEEAAIGAPPRGAGVLGVLLHRFEPLRLSSVMSHPWSVGFPPNHPPMESFLGVPIRSGNRMLGSLYLTNKQGGGEFTVSDELAIQALGSHAAVAIHNLFMMSRQRMLVSGLINAQEEERRTLAYDLHDGLTQYVMASHMHFEAFRVASDHGKPEKAQRELERGLHYLKESVLESRRLVNGLRTLALDDLGLAGALEQLVNEEKARGDCPDIELVHNIADERFTKNIETAAYRVVQEAVTNVRKHSQAKRARILVLVSDTAEPRSLSVEVRDWGVGFVPEERVGAYSHLGLQGIIERVELLDGKYTIHSAPGEGTRIMATFPIIAPKADNGEPKE